MATIVKPHAGATVGGVMNALRAKTIPEAIVKGFGNAVILNTANKLLGNPLGAVSFSFPIPIPGLSITITPITILNYFFLNGFKANLDVNALIGAVAAILAGVNPGGDLQASQTFTTQQKTGLGGF